MVLTLRRRLNSEDNDPPVLKRKVFEVDTKSLIEHEAVEFYAGSPHSEGILQHLNMFRDNGLFTDTVIKACHKEFHCHRALLAACSPYFRAMFSNDVRERHEVLIEINGVSAEMMDTLLTFMYTAHAEITTQNVEHLYEASSLFQITALGNACVMFLETQMDPCNCLGFMLFAEKHFLKELSSSCRSYARANFSEVVQHEEFLNLSYAELIKYIDVDDLCASKEEIVFEAVMRWVYKDVEKRKSALKDVLEHVRLPLLHPTYFIQTVEGDCLIQNSSECYDLLHEARRYHVLGNEMVSPRTRPRRSTGVSEVIVVVGGCERAGGFNLPYTECYDPVSGVWKSLTKLPEFTKSEYAVCALRNDILVSGGRINSRDVWMYSSQLHMWMKVASLTRGRWRHKMGVLLGKAYAVGGYDGHSRVHYVECYDSFTNRWTEVAPMIEAVSSPAVTSCTNKLFVIGGGPDDDTCSDKVQCYDPLENTWVLRASIPTANRCISAVSLNKLIYVYGGLTKNILCYDPTEDTWMTVAQTFCKMESCGMSVCNGKIFILGGRGENGESLDTVLCFDPASGISKCPVKMPRPISHHGCVTVHRYDKEYKISPQPK